MKSVSLALAICLLRPLAASAEVVALSRVDAALASSTQIHSCTDKPPFGSARCVAVGKEQYRGFLFSKSLDYGNLDNGQDLLIVPLGSGGSGGVFADMLFTSVMTKPYFIGVVPSETAHLSVYISGGRIVVETPRK